MSKLDAYIEAEKRGILPPDKTAVLQEARRRGLVGGAQPKAAKQPEQKESLGRTLFDQGMQGATFGFADEVSDRVGALIASKVTGLPYKDLLNEARTLTKERSDRQFEQHPVASIAANAAGGLVTGGAGAATKAGAAAGNFIRTGNTAARAAKGAVSGAALGAAYGAGSAESGERLEGAGLGAVLGGVTGGAAPVLGRAARGARDAVIPKVDEALKPLAKRARDFGIPLRADQVAPTRVRRTVQKISQEIPFSGADAFEDTQRKAFSKAVAKTIGQESDDLGPDTINKFLSDSSKKFNEAIGTDDFKIVNDDIGAIDKIEKSAIKNVTKDVFDIVKSHTEQFKDDLTEIIGKKIVATGVDAGGMPITAESVVRRGAKIGAKKLSSLRSDLVSSLPKIDSKARPYVSEIIDIIDDIAERQIPEGSAKALKQARREWRNFKTIEPLLEESTDGLINPTKLMSRVKSSKYIKASRAKVGDDDLIDLARIGKHFLPKQGGSDTFQKSALGAGAVGLLGTASANPLLALGLGTKAAAGLAANRAVQKGVLSNQRLIDLGINAAPKTAKRLPKTPLTALIAGQHAAAQ